MRLSLKTLDGPLTLLCLEDLKPKSGLFVHSSRHFAFVQAAGIFLSRERPLMGFRRQCKSKLLELWMLKIKGNIETQVSSAPGLPRYNGSQLGSQSRAENSSVSGNSHFAAVAHTAVSVRYFGSQIDVQEDDEEVIHFHSCSVSVLWPNFFENHYEAESGYGNTQKQTTIITGLAEMSTKQAKMHHHTTVLLAKAKAARTAHKFIPIPSIPN